MINLETTRHRGEFWVTAGCLAGLLASAMSASSANDTREDVVRRESRDRMTLPTADIAENPEQHHVIVARGTRRDWQGHPSTVLMPDGKTLFCVWQGRRDGTRRHGAPAGYLSRSDDGGLTWSQELDVPASWLDVGRGHPTIHRLVDQDGIARLFVFCRDEKRTTFLQAMSEDEGKTWSEMRPIGLIGPTGDAVVGWTAPISILAATERDGRRKHLMWYEKTRDGRPAPGAIWQSASYDGGLTWGESKPVVDRAGASEPGAVRSPDGKQLMLLIRENERALNSLFSVSDDEGETWTEPQELSLALTGDRHNARYAPDGRLVVAFRPVRPRTGQAWGQMDDSHFTAWVGRYEDILEGREGQYRIKLVHSHAGADHTYPGLEVLPDGTFVATTYIRYQPDELHSVVSARFRLEETDRIAAGTRAVSSLPPEGVRPADATEPDGTQRDDPVEIGSRRELFLDDLVVDRLEGAARRVFHRPVPREVVLTFDKPWEGETCGYISVIQDGDLYRMWYRASGARSGSSYAYAESQDGIHWNRPTLRRHEYQGSMDNNIVIAGPRAPGTSDFAVFKDDNPKAPPEARYKAVGLKRGPGTWQECTKELAVFHSPNGLDWAEVEGATLLNDGYFDSQNLAFWDSNIAAYRAYYRTSARAIPTDGFEFPDHSGRDIKTATTTDFTRWTPPGTQLRYMRRPPAQFYTNVIRPYHRAPHIYIGMPKMYNDRGAATKEFVTPAIAQMPDAEERAKRYEDWKRFSPLSETHLMWSRDGLNFDLAPSAFITPGPERPSSWTYSDAVAWHLVETESVFAGAPPELSLYKHERYYADDVQLRRFTLRLDGFASIHASIAGGELVTPPLVFQGSALSMNFASSAFGSLRVELQDADGAPIPGFTLDDSIELYGDTVARNAMWKADPDLGALAGTPVRLRFVMRDVDLYSIKFE